MQNNQDTKKAQKYEDSLCANDVEDYSDLLEHYLSESTLIAKFEHITPITKHI